jgi:hypothetical protein
LTARLSGRRKTAIVGPTELTFFEFLQGSKIAAIFLGIRGDTTLLPQSLQVLSSTAYAAASQSLLLGRARAFAERVLRKLGILVALSDSAFDSCMIVVLSGMSGACDDERSGGSTLNKLGEENHCRYWRQVWELSEVDGVVQLATATAGRYLFDTASNEW